MTKPPISKLAVGFYVLGIMWLVSGVYALNQIMQIERFVSAGSTMSYGITTIGSGILYATLTVMLGKVVQMISDIRWKLFEGEANA